jgi:hypothetical protein
MCCFKKRSPVCSLACPSTRPSSQRPPPRRHVKASSTCSGAPSPKTGSSRCSSSRSRRSRCPSGSVCRSERPSSFNEYAATVGRLQIVYQLFRVLVGALGIRLNGHAAFVRPLVFPMSLGAAAVESGVAPTESLDERRVEEIKATDAAAENYGNFYGQNLSPVQPGANPICDRALDGARCAHVEPDPIHAMRNVA